MNQERLMIFSCHALDFLSKSGGAIAQQVQNGAKARVVCLSCGERGEAGSVWKSNPDIGEDAVREIKRSEAARAVEILGAEIQFLDYSDHPLVSTAEKIVEMAGCIKEYEPTVILTHYSSDTANPDHATAHKMVLSALRCAHSNGVHPQLAPCKLVRVYMFEPGKPDIERFSADTYFDITGVIEQKEKAMACAETQQYLVEICRERDSYRGGLARRHVEDPSIRYAEGFLRLNPYIGKYFY